MANQNTIELVKEIIVSPLSGDIIQEIVFTEKQQFAGVVENAIGIFFLEKKTLRAKSIFLSLQTIIDRSY